MADLATVTDIRAPRHSWLKEQRADDPTRHIYTCRRVGCGLKKRSELVDGQWLEVWRWPDGEEGRDRKVPGCRAGERAGRPVLTVVPDLPAEPALPVVADAPVKLCARCHPPCGRPGRPYPGGSTCDEKAARVAEVNAAHLAELRAATSGMGVPTWRGGDAA